VFEVFVESCDLRGENTAMLALLFCNTKRCIMQQDNNIIQQKNKHNKPFSVFPVTHIIIPEIV
jgi:hypothetical protein